MPVFVDSSRGRKNEDGRAVYRMSADTARELHRIARKLDLQRDWCSDLTHPGIGVLYYEITSADKKRAVALGAIAVDTLPLRLRMGGML